MATIHRDTIFVEVESLFDSQAFHKGDKIGYYRQDGKWRVKDDNNKTYVSPVSYIRYDDCSKIINQYSMADIIYYMFNRNDDYYTVLWEILEEAVMTTFTETKVTSLEDIYEYISSNLI